MRRCAVMVAVLAAACAEVKPYPEQYATCYERLQRDAAQLLPGFEAYGYRPGVRFQMDENLRGGNGFRSCSDNCRGSGSRGRTGRRRHPSRSA